MLPTCPKLLKKALAQDDSRNDVTDGRCPTLRMGGKQHVDPWAFRDIGAPEAAAPNPTFILAVVANIADAKSPSLSSENGRSLMLFTDRGVECVQHSFCRRRNSGRCPL
jgi:hypothetical protein